MTETQQAITQYHDFAEVIRELRKDPDRRAQRIGWNGKGLTIRLLTPGSLVDSQEQLPYFIMEYPKPTDEIGGIKIGNDLYPNGAIVPWLASQTDMLAFDWIIL